MAKLLINGHELQIDADLLRRQAAAVGAAISVVKSVSAEFRTPSLVRSTDERVELLEGVWEMLHAILDQTT